MNITMDGKYAYRRDPRKQVRVLCIDKAGTYPVAVLPPDRDQITTHAPCGRHVLDITSGYDLVPLDETLTVTPGIYRTRGGMCVTICYIRSGDEERKGYLAVGWESSSPIRADTWKLDGQFSDCSTHRLDLIERIGDLP